MVRGTTALARLLGLALPLHDRYRAVILNEPSKNKPRALQGFGLNSITYERFNSDDLSTPFKRFDVRGLSVECKTIVSALRDSLNALRINSVNGNGLNVKRLIVIAINVMTFKTVLRHDGFTP
ncbi:hypothetical protein NDU88_005811 [Pleurodeles waltl]|uniref:Uncharacterized protein n=1 Tax=Pleurodeles waltl TaxID=8319 RepID=A0AAV7LDL3_PLEWA|nr:hypothetical protein NDU88_005811 [Pleurodeles waltl]